MADEDEDALHLMHEETGEQIELSRQTLGDSYHWLTDGMELRVRHYNGAPLTARLPDEGVYTVAEQGQGTENHKKVTLDNGKQLRAPAYVGVGDSVVVDLKEVAFVRKA